MRSDFPPPTDATSPPDGNGSGGSEADVRAPAAGVQRAEVSADRTTAVWPGRGSVRDCVRLVLGIAGSVEQWHLTDQLHRSIRCEQLIPGENDEHPRLLAPTDDAIEFGGPFADPDLCPPELRSLQPMAIPRSLNEARQVLTEYGIPTLPERIDVYQLGTLLCRLVSGKSVRAYLSSPSIMSRIPQPVRRVIDRCVGYDESNRTESVRELMELLEATVDERGWSGESAASRDTDVAAASDTRVARRVPPFQKLGHFEVLEEIGHGGMGVVYRGYDRSLDRTVALKVLHPRFSNDSAFVKRFRAEAAAAARLAHPHLVPIYFIGEDAGRHFYAMQFIDGESLAERLHRADRLPQEEVLAILQQVLLGLSAAHRQGFVHRDIKPGNILLDRQNGSAVLTDFGLARGPVADELADSNLVMGTAEYMSPEQAQGENTDARSDLYSVGVLLYQLLSGRTPFDARTPSGQLIHHVYEQPEPLAQVAPHVDAALLRIVDRLLRKRPADRFQSVDELLVALRAVSGMTSSESPHSSSVLDSDVSEKVTSKPDRSRRQRGLGIVLTLLLLACGVWLTRPAQQATGTTLAPHRDGVWAIAFSPDGKFVLSGGGQSSSLKEAGDTQLRLWNADSGRMVKQSERLPIGPEQLVVLDSNARVFAIGSAREGTGTTVVWDALTGQQQAPTFDDPFAFHFDAVRLDDTTAIACGNRGLVELRFHQQSRSIEQRLLRQTERPARAIAVNHNETGLNVFTATEDDDRRPIVIRYSGPELREQQRLTGFSGPILALAASADGTMLISRATDTGDQAAIGDRVSAWNMATGQLLWTRGPFAPATRSLSLSRDGARVLTIGEAVLSSSSKPSPQSALLLDAATGETICRIQTGSPHLLSVALSPDGHLAALGDAEGRVSFSRLP